VSLVLLVVAVVCWLVAGIPGFIRIAIGFVDWGWLGMFFFGLWLIIAGTPQFLASARQPR
jgi:hypothetical protein